MRRAGMKHLKDRLVSIRFDETLEPSIMRLLDLVRESPSALLPVKDSNAAAESVFSSRGFHLYPTVPKTTLFYDPASDCFLKILHPLPLTLRDIAHSLITDKARRIFSLSEQLRHRGVKVPRVRAFGRIREGRKPFYAVDRVQGRSLYDILIREQEAIPTELCLKVIDEVARLHRLGYWFGDAHLSHIFVHEGEINGFIDIDSVRSNRPFRVSQLAKDIAGLNHPGLPVGRDDKESLLRRYAEKMNLQDEKAFRHMVKDYSEKRWTSARHGINSVAGAPGP